MTLQPTSRAKERILLYGYAGTGKTNAWCTISRWYADSGTNGTFFVLDTDAAIDRMADGFHSIKQNCVGMDCNTWPDFTGNLDSSITRATSEDFLIVDMVDKAWDKVQDYFIERVHGKEADEWFLEYREAGKDGHPLAGEYGINWAIINKLYSRWIGSVIRFPGHVLCCTPADAVTRDGRTADKPEILTTFGRVGVKPKGQKLLAHQFHTVLLMGQTRNGWEFTSVKDRSRERVENQPMSDFVLNYLKPIGGWEI